MSWIPPEQALATALERCTAIQLEAIRSTSRQLCIQAGAGSGKTRVLTLRIARRVADEQLDPTRGLVATFSRKAAEELRHRLFLLGVRDLQAGTIHAIALRMLNDFRSDRRQRKVVLVPDRTRMISSVLETSYSSGMRPAAIEAEISWAKSRGLTPTSYLEAASFAGRKSPGPRQEIAETFLRYEQLRVQQGKLDLDDLLLEATRLMSEDLSFREAMQWRYQHLSLDEAQDLNPAQRDLLLVLAGDDPDLTFVGDPNQSVYGWNGADPNLMADLVDRYPTTQTVILLANHRSTKRIVDVANAALGAPGARSTAREGGTPPKVLSFPTESDEARGIALTLLQKKSKPETLNSTAVLARTNAQLQAIADELDVVGVPYRFAGGDLAPGVDSRSTVNRSTPELDTDAPTGIVLATFHRSKGLEWSSVFVIGVAEGIVPFSAASTHEELAEERRLLYVALTRATDTLTISWSERRSSAGRAEGRRRGPSPWLAAIEQELARQARAEMPLEGEERQRQLDRLRKIASDALND